MTAETGIVDRGAPYRDPELPVNERVKDLLARMTLEEKVAQLGSAWVFELARDDVVDDDRFAVVCRHGLGQITRIAGASTLTADRAAGLANELQRRLVEGTRLGIPAIVHEEICSGVMARGSTVYPQAIGVASTFEPELNAAIADAVRVQMRSAGAHQGLSPVLDVARDPRWGRTEETYGEDPYLVARMGTAFVQGLQGSDLADGVVATAKHFVGHGASEGGMNWAPVHLPERELREVFLHPFEAAVRVGGLRSVMNAYHELDGVPCAANGRLLNGILRDAWGFDGIVVADYFSVDQLAAYHRVARDKTEAALFALGAGIDVELPSSDCFADPLLSAIEAGEADVSALDEAVRRVLRLKVALGLFERPYVDEQAATAAADTASHRELAATVARKSLVLLRNDGVLPFGPAPGIVAVIGPNAHDVRHLLGDYTYPAHIEALMEMRKGDSPFDVPVPDGFELGAAGVQGVSILDALTAAYGGAVRYARGCAVNDDDTSGFAEAVELAAAADVVVLVVGDRAGLTRGCTSGEGRDRSSLALPGVQEELARAVLATGTPVVTVLVVGRPCGTEELHRRSAAVLLAWLPGQEGGGAIADALAGTINPGGKLPISFPRCVGQLPVFYGHKVSGGRSHWHGNYVDGPTSPLYPFGHGLSYTTFALVDPVVLTPTASPGDSFTLSVSVANIGPLAGEEVVEVYVRDLHASVTRPALELKSFVRVAVDAGASASVRFEIPVAQLGFYDADHRYVVEAGEIEVLVGTSSAELISAGTVTVDAGGPVEKAFDGSRTVS
jgi:beta-glucosidase